jgi:hypothetical protein
MAARVRPRLATVAVAAVLALGVAGCGAGASRSAALTPGVSAVPGASLSAALAQARGQLVRALEAAGLVVADPRVAYRPAEAPSFAAAPRAVLQVQLASDLAHGFLTVYEFPSAAAATDAAREQAAYVASGTGRIQFPAGTRFILRQLGAAVVFYAWSPSVMTDPQAPDVEAALALIGTEIAIPS